MSVELLLRPEIEQHAYRLTCRFTVTAPVGGIKTESWLDYALKEKLLAGRLFIEQMEKQGWRYRGGGLDFTAGPLPHINPRGIPNAPNIPKRRPGEASIPIERIDRIDRDYYVQQMEPIRATELWDYELTGTFTKAVLTEFLEEKPDDAG